jgi:hypothetical protein
MTCNTQHIPLSCSSAAETTDRTLNVSQPDAGWNGNGVLQAEYKQMGCKIGYGEARSMKSSKRSCQIKKSSDSAVDCQTGPQSPFHESQIGISNTIQDGKRQVCFNLSGVHGKNKHLLLFYILDI